MSACRGALIHGKRLKSSCFKEIRAGGTWADRECAHFNAAKVFVERE